MIEYPVIFIIALLLNLSWEFWHWRYYETCLHMIVHERQILLATMAVKDAAWISIFYWILTYGLFLRGWQLLVGMSIMGFVFSFVDEKISLYFKRWKYAVNMPLVLGVGITPLCELAVTGVASVLLAGLFI
jgi:hypothetical protein